MGRGGKAPVTSWHRGGGCPGIYGVEGLGKLTQVLHLFPLTLNLYSSRVTRDVAPKVVVRGGMLASLQNPGRKPEQSVPLGLYGHVSSSLTPVPVSSPSSPSPLGKKGWPFPVSNGPSTTEQRASLEAKPSRPGSSCAKMKK